MAGGRPFDSLLPASSTSYPASAFPIAVVRRDTFQDDPPIVRFQTWEIIPNACFPHLESKYWGIILNPKSS